MRWIIFFLLFCEVIYSQQPFTPLINKAWQKNEMLHSKSFQLQSAELVLKEAKAMYMPTISFGTQYTLAAGGRNISFPIGDLLNPVYGTLNQLTNSNKFGTLENAEINFLPNNFYDARFRIQQPIYYPDIQINKKVKLANIELKALELKAYKRSLSKEVMDAYFNLAQAKEAILIIENSEKLLKEANRTTQSMIKNGVALPSALSRIENQDASLMAQKLDMQNKKDNAVKYLFFLTQDTNYVESDINFSQLPLLPMNNGVREELLQLSQAEKLYGIAADRENDFYKPKIGTQLDLGSQAFNFGFQPYVLFGLNLDLSLFDGKRHLYKKQEAMAMQQSQSSQKEHTEQIIELQQSISESNLKSSIEQAETYKSRIESTKKLYNDVFKKYKEGIANYIELVDAQSQLTQIELQYNLAKLQAWLKWSEHFYNTASYKID